MSEAVSVGDVLVLIDRWIAMADELPDSPEQVLRDLRDCITVRGAYATVPPGHTAEATLGGLVRPTQVPDAHDMDVIYYLIGHVSMYGLQGVDADNSAPYFSVALETAAYALRDHHGGVCPTCHQPIIDRTGGVATCGCGAWTDNPDVRQQACKSTAEAILAINMAGYWSEDEVNHPSSGG